MRNMEGTSTLPSSGEWQIIPRSTRNVKEGCICMRSRDWRGDDEQVPIQAGGTRLLVQCTNGMGPMPTTSGE